MYKKYKTEYSNHVHQLVVSVSRHFYITDNGKFRHQKKVLEARLDRPESHTKRHVVHYLIRDHFSGLFYAELTDTHNLFSIFEFLYRAWSKKEYHPFCGLPHAVTVPKNIRAVWPSLLAFLERESIQLTDVTSGFQGGVRDIRTWEQELRTDLYTSGYPPDYSEVLEHAQSTCARFNLSDYRGQSKATVWRKNLPNEIRLPGPKETFS